MGDRRVVHLFIRGRVQGVGFRAFVENEAAARQLDGWVRNRRDGSVEAAAAGPREAVDSLIEALRKGPPPRGSTLWKLGKPMKACSRAAPISRNYRQFSNFLQGILASPCQLRPMAGRNERG